MTIARRYVAVRFKPQDSRTYTYHFDGEQLGAGDQVVVSTNRGPATVTVVSVSDEKPSFETRPIIGKERPIVANQEAR